MIIQFRLQTSDEPRFERKVYVNLLFCGLFFLLHHIRIQSQHTLETMAHVNGVNGHSSDSKARKVYLFGHNLKRSCECCGEPDYITTHKLLKRLKQILHSCTTPSSASWASPTLTIATNAAMSMLFFPSPRSQISVDLQSLCMSRLDCRACINAKSTLPSYRPNKVAILKHCDDLTDEARLVGACNTLFWRKDADGTRKLVGHNTEYVKTPPRRKEALELTSRLMTAHSV